MIALIDGDIVAYRCAASAEKEEVWVALYRTEQLMMEVLSNVSATAYRVFLSGSTNFRKEIDPEYKANRVDVVKPAHLAACKEFLVTQFNATTTEDHEADDALGYSQKMEGTIICTIDKDLKQVPGHHYHLTKKVMDFITPEQGLLKFYTQTLVGDTADNVFGIRGIGPVKAGKILNELRPDEYYQKCREMYDDDERFHLNCKLLYIWRKPNDNWEPPECDQDDMIPELTEVA